MPKSAAEKKLVANLIKFCKANTKALTSTSLGSLLILKGKVDLYKSTLPFGGLPQLNRKHQLGLKLKAGGRSKSVILKELKILDEYGIPITQASLIKFARSGLLQSIKQYGKLSDFKQELRLPVRRMTQWNKEKIKKMYLELSEKLGAPPTYNYLDKNGYGALKNAITRYFNGVRPLRKALKLKNEFNKPAGYWTLEKTLGDFRKFLKANKEALKANSAYGTMERQKLHGLRTAIGIWGGLRKLNSKYNLGLSLQRAKWTKEMVLQEMKSFHEKNITLTQPNLIKTKHSGLLIAAGKFGGFNSMKEEIGVAVKRYKYWTDEIILSRMKLIVDEFGNMISLRLLASMGHGDLSRAISKRGGLIKFCNLLGTHVAHNLKAKDGHHLQSTYEYMFDNILYKHRIPHKIHCRIDKRYNYRCDFLIDDTYVEIVGYTEKSNEDYHKSLNEKIQLYNNLEKKYIIVTKKEFSGNIQQIEAKILSKLEPLLPVKSKLQKPRLIEVCPSAYWADLENIKKELLPLVKKYGRMPLDKEFRKEKKSPLIGGVYKYHGNLYELGEKLNIPVINKPKGYYSFDNIVTIYRTICIKEGHYVSQKYLSENGMKGLLTPITKYGGIFVLRKACNLNFKNQEKFSGITSVKNAAEMYKSLCVERGRYLRMLELRQINQPLNNYIQRFSNFDEIRKLTGLSKNYHVINKYRHAIDEAVNEYKEICLEHGYFLTMKELTTCVETDLMKYISANISIGRLRELTGLDLMTNQKAKFMLKQKNAKHRQSPKKNIQRALKYKVVQEYKDICVQNGRYLSMDDLHKIGNKLLSGRISRFGGFIAVRNLCNLNYNIRCSGPKHSRTQTIREYKKLCIEKNVFLNYKELEQLEENELSRSIKHYGGMYRIRKLTRLPLKKTTAVKKKRFDFSVVLDTFKKLSIQKRQFFSKNDFY